MIERRSGVRVSAPASLGVGADGLGFRVDQFRGSLDGPIDLGDDTVGAAIAAGLGAAGLELVDEIPFDGGDPLIRGALPTGPVSLGPEGQVEFAVPAGPDEDAAILFEEDGLLRWVFPERDGADARRDTGGRLRFRAEVLPAQDRQALRGGVAEWIKGRIKAWVVRWARPVVAAGMRAALAWWEGRRHQGLVHLQGAYPEYWTTLPSLRALPLPEDRPARLLLMVHGTFSSVSGSFGHLCDTADGRSLLGRAFDAYDQVLGFDHPTLSVDPEVNARALFDALRGRAWKKPPEIDVICNSRGALVTRTLVERVLPEAGFPARVGRACLVAPANGGTLLATPTNWRDLLDIVTTLVTAAARAASVLPQARAVAESVRAAIEGLAIFAKALVSTVVDAQGAPGLAAMDLEGSYVKRLNEQSLTGLPWRPTYHVATSNFESGASGPDQGLSRRALLFAADTVVDKLFKGAANDLVVDNASADRMGPAASAWMAPAGHLRLEANPSVFHTNFFLDQRLVAHLSDWLELDAGASLQLGRSRDEALGVRRRPNLADELVGLRGTDEAGGRIDATMPGVGDEDFRGAAPDSGAEPLDQAAPGAGDASAPARAPFFAQAVPPREVEVGGLGMLSVTLSREAVEEIEGAVSGQASGEAALPLEVELVPIANLATDGASSAQVPFPAPGQPVDLDFKVRGTASGVGHAWILVRQGLRRLLKLVVETRVVQGTAATGFGAAVEGRPVIEPQAPPPLALEVIRMQRGGDVVYRYQLESSGAETKKLVFESKPIAGDWRVWLNGLYKRVEGLWKSSGGNQDAFTVRLKAFGGELFDELFPDMLRSELWSRRKSLAGLQLIEDDPGIPWELVHLKDPTDGALPDEDWFLGELGLLRSMWNVGLPAEIRVGPGRVFTVAPEYAPPGLKLPGAQREADWFVTTLGARRVPARFEDVEKLVRGPAGFDVLHVACHGEADAADPSGSRLLLEGRVKDGQWYPEWLEARTVQQTARLEAEGVRPIVILNACQVGRQGRVLSGPGGWPAAFLQRGCGLFVGPSWSVGDGTALTFATSFVAALRGGADARSAALQARADARKAGDPTWLAYSVFAAPHARVTAG